MNQHLKKKHPPKQLNLSLPEFLWANQRVTASVNHSAWQQLFSASAAKMIQMIIPHSSYPAIAPFWATPAARQLERMRHAPVNSMNASQSELHVWPVNWWRSSGLETWWNMEIDSMTSERLLINDLRFEPLENITLSSGEANWSKKQCYAVLEYCSDCSCVIWCSYCYLILKRIHAHRILWYFAVFWACKSGECWMQPRKFKIAVETRQHDEEEDWNPWGFIRGLAQGTCII